MTPTIKTEGPEDRLLRANDVAQRLAVSIRTVWKLRASGELPAVAIGRSARFRESDVHRIVLKGAA